MRLLVCDMAGTVINEHGLVYKTLLKTLKKIGATQIDKSWYGLEKKEVISNVVDELKPYEDNLKKRLYLEFQNNLDEAYFGTQSTISLIDDKIPDYFNKLRANDVKVALNTGYDARFQQKIIKHLNMTDYIDDFISSQEVVMGRPGPFMIQELMKRNNIKNSKDVIKIGDTKNDILEGINAKCGTTVGVLSGAGNVKDLANADIISENIISYLDTRNI